MSPLPLRGRRENATGALFGVACKAVQLNTAIARQYSSTSEDQVYFGKQLLHLRQNARAICNYFDICVLYGTEVVRYGTTAGMRKHVCTQVHASP
eukprot:3280370-Prymnesium_polylepis.1